MPELTLVISFIAGLLSFFSPCCLPLIPGFIAHLSHTSIKELKDAGLKIRLRIFLNSLAFVAGLSLVFAILGVLLNTIFSNILFIVQEWLGKISGTFIIIFGLYMLRLIRISWLEQEHKIRISKKFSKSLPSSYITSFFFGAAFGVAWTPCVGAILGSVLALTVTLPGKSFILLLAYAFGLGIPFLIVGIFTQEITSLIRRYSIILKYFDAIVGILLIILGILIFTNTLSLIANLFVARNYLQ